MGRGLSLCLAREGHTILATDLRLDAARETFAQIEAAGGPGDAIAILIPMNAGSVAVYLGIIKAVVWL